MTRPLGALTSLWVLDAERNPVAEHDWLKWAEWFAHDKWRSVGQATLPDGGHVSTCFIGCGHVLFETAHFGPGEAGCVGILWRGKTWAEAEEAHAAAVALLTVTKAPR